MENNKSAVEWFANKVLHSRQMGFISNKQFAELLNEAKEMESNILNNLPIHIHDGISNTTVYIEDGIIHVKPTVINNGEIKLPCNFDHNGECLICDCWPSECAYKRMLNKDYRYETKEELEDMFKNTTDESKTI